jgi:hypothetical protein
MAIFNGRLICIKVSFKSFKQFKSFKSSEFKIVWNHWYDWNYWMRIGAYQAPIAR